MKMKSLKLQRDFTKRSHWISVRISFRRRRRRAVVGMKAADQSHAPPVPRPFSRAKQPSTTSRHEGEGGGADRRTRPSRRGGTSKRGRGWHHHLLRPCSSRAPNWGATRARTAAAALSTTNQDLSSTSAQIQFVSSRGCDDDSNPCAQIQILPSRGCDDESNPRGETFPLNLR